MTRKIQFLVVLAILVASMFNVSSAKVVTTPAPIDSAEVYLVNDTTTIISVPATVEIYDSLYVDSATYNVDDLLAKLLAADTGFKYTEDAVNARIAERAEKLKAIEAQKQAEADSLAAIEAANLKKLHADWNREVKPMKLDSVWAWSITTDKDTTDMRISWLAKRYNVHISDKLTPEEAIESMKAQIDERQKFNQSVDARIAKAVSPLKTSIDEHSGEITRLNDSLCFVTEAMEVLYEIAGTNAENIQTLAETTVKEINTIKRSLWDVTRDLKVVTEVTERAKLRKEQGDDNRQLFRDLKSKTRGSVKPMKIELAEPDFSEITDVDDGK